MKDEPIDWEETIDPSESLTIDHEIDIKPVRKISFIMHNLDNSFLIEMKIAVITSSSIRILIAGNRTQCRRGWRYGGGGVHTADVRHV